MKSSARFPSMKGYTVFNVEQIEGLPEDYWVQPAAAKAHLNPFRGQNAWPMPARRLLCGEFYEADRKIVDMEP